MLIKKNFFPESSAQTACKIGNDLGYCSRSYLKCDQGRNMGRSLRCYLAPCCAQEIVLHLVKNEEIK